MEQAEKMAEAADGVIADTALVRLLGQYGREAPAHIGRYVKSMKDALR